jgi:glc operon protein GlcG
MMRGGVPITAGGQIVGAVGVSSDTSQHDVLIAEAGIAALTQ